jgi:hypothetical protein
MKVVGGQVEVLSRVHRLPHVLNTEQRSNGARTEGDCTRTHRLRRSPALWAGTVIEVNTRSQTP